MDIATNFLSQLNSMGYPARIVSARHLPQLRDELRERLQDGELDPGFYEERLAWFDTAVPGSLPAAQSVILLAVPRPRARIRFAWGGRAHAVIIPPTYVGNTAVRRQIERTLAQLLAGFGYGLAGSRLPLKLLAARSGLARYGRNNITYVPGLGSYHQLVAAYSDLPPPEDAWQPAEMLPACRDCDACRGACPTGAIPADRFLLQAERCLAFHNEKPGDVPFPAWIKPEWHNCLVGCMVCQNVCPENRGEIGWTEQGPEFSEDETALLMGGASLDRLPAATQNKLEQLELIDSLADLPRNLGVLLNRVGA